VPLSLGERSPKEIRQIIKRRVEAMKDVKGCHEVGVRITPKRVDVTMHVSLDSRLNLREAHRIASNAERDVKRILPNARITIQSEPAGDVREDIRTLAKEAADRLPGSRGVHNVHIQKIDGELCVDLHLEVGPNMTVKHAHEISDEIERKLRTANPRISEITIHMESAPNDMYRESKEPDEELKRYISHSAKRYDGIKSLGQIKTRRVATGRHVVFRCRFDPNLRMKEACEITTDLEKAIKSAYPDIERIDIHEEPTPRP